MKEGKLIGFLADVHIYQNQIENCIEQLKRPTHQLCQVDIPNFKSIYEWEYTDLEIKNYTHSGILKFPLAV